MQMNLREETRHFNKNSRHFKWFLDSHSGFETHTNTEEEESLPLRTS